MIRKTMKRVLRREEGSGLVLSLMVLLVLSVLGASLGVVTVGSYRLGNTNRDSSSAYYIAEAGANMAYEEIKSNVLDAYEESESQGNFFDVEIESLLNEIRGSKYNNFEQQSGQAPTATIEIEETSSEDDRRHYNIESTGNVAGNTRVVEKDFMVEWVNKDSDGGLLPYIPLESSTIVRSNLEVDTWGISITGNIHVDALEPQGVQGTAGFNFTDTIYLNPLIRGNSNEIIEEGIRDSIENIIIREKELPWTDYYTAVESISFLSPDNYSPFPDTEIYRNSNEHSVINDSDILINNYLAHNYILDFSEKYYSADKLVINSNRKLNIRTNNQTVNLVLNDLDIQQGHIEIIDDGTLNLYVLDSININGSINSNDNPRKLNLFYNGEDKLTLAGSDIINGGLYINKADLELTAAGNIYGPILSNGNNIDISGGSVNNIFILAPKAKVNLYEGGKINGIVIADEIYLEGGTEINYREYNFENYPIDFWGPPDTDTERDDIKDLISSTPAIEQ